MTSASWWGRGGTHRHVTMQNPSKPLKSEEHTSELQSQPNLVCRLLLEKKNKQVLGEGGIGVLFICTYCGRFVALSRSMRPRFPALQITVTDAEARDEEDILGQVLRPQC